MRTLSKLLELTVTCLIGRTKGLVQASLLPSVGCSNESCVALLETPVTLFSGNTAFAKTYPEGLCLSILPHIRVLNICASNTHSKDHWIFTKSMPSANQAQPGKKWSKKTAARCHQWRIQVKKGSSHVCCQNFGGFNSLCAINVSVPLC